MNLFLASKTAWWVEKPGGLWLKSCSNYTPASAGFGANDFPWFGCNFTNGKEKMVSKILFDLDKGQIWENCLQLLLQSSKSPNALALKLGCQSWPLTVYALCIRSGCLKARKLDLLEMTGLFSRCLGFFTFRGPLWTSAHHHFALTMVSLQSGPRWWSGPLTDISPNTPDSPFTNFLHSSFIIASWPL